MTAPYEPHPGAHVPLSFADRIRAEVGSTAVLTPVGAMARVCATSWRFDVVEATGDVLGVPRGSGALMREVDGPLLAANDPTADLSDAQWAAVADLVIATARERRARELAGLTPAQRAHAEQTARAEREREREKVLRRRAELDAELAEIDARDGRTPEPGPVTVDGPEAEVADPVAAPWWRRSATP